MSIIVALALTPAVVSAMEPSGLPVVGDFGTPRCDPAGAWVGPEGTPVAAPVPGSEDQTRPHPPIGAPWTARR